MQLDPLLIPFTLPAAAYVVADAQVDLTAAELAPATSPTTGILASRGGTDAYVGYIYGVSVVIANAILAADLQLLLSGAELLLRAGGRLRSIPFRSALRVQPHVVASPATAATAFAATCGAPGTPAYLLPVEPLPWTGVPTCAVLRRTMAPFTLGSTVNGHIEIWGVFAKGESKDVEGKACNVDTMDDVVAYAQGRAALAAAMRNGSAITPAGMGVLTTG